MTLDQVNIHETARQPTADRQSKSDRV